MTNVAFLREWIEREMGDVQASWSVGTFGAIAEFLREAGEPADLITDGRICQAVTARGGIRIEGFEYLRPVAYETVSKHPDQWGHAIAFCLDESGAAMNRRQVLTELGRDADALRGQDRGGVLFDLGLHTFQVDACIRTSDTGLLSALRRAEGRSLFDHDNPAMPAIIHASPHRVFITRIGRAEVYQPIPLPGGFSPEGPHTHVLPKLLRSRRTHAATNPVPTGLVPCAHVYPAHPGKDAVGQARPFDPTLHEKFQDLLASFGISSLNDLKKLVHDGVEAGKAPETLVVPENRFARAAIRVALRQRLALAGPSPGLSRWRLYHDRVAETADAEDGDEQSQHG